MQPLAWLVAAMLACSAHAFARPSAYLGLPRSLAVTTVAPPVRVRASISASSHTEVEEEEEVSFEKEVLKNARVTESWAGEGAWVLVTREFGEFEEEEAENEGTAIEGPDVTITSRGEAGAGEVEIEVDGEDDEEGVILVRAERCASRAQQPRRAVEEIGGAGGGVLHKVQQHIQCRRGRVLRNVALQLFLRVDASECAPLSSRTKLAEHLVGACLQRAADGHCSSRLPAAVADPAALLC